MAPASAALLATCLWATAAQGSTMTVLHGEALVSHGDGFERVSGVANLSPGDTVMAKAGSSVKVTFSNGCTVFLGMGMVFNVPAEPPCGDAASNRETTTGAVPDAASPSSAQDWSAVTQTTATPDPMQTSMMPWLLGGAALGGVAAATLAFGGSGGSTPASP